jgi:hypothetical protein
MNWGAVKRILFVIVREGEKASKQECPGEENCIKYKTSLEKEIVCERCPSGVGPIEKFTEIEGYESVLPFVNQILYLYGLKNVGATFLIDDLSREEWDGLMLLQQVKNEVEAERYERERHKSEAKDALRSSGRK